MAEHKNGAIPKPVSFSYIWGDVLKELDDARPDVRIVNLETSVTTSDAWLPKGINYRMHPANTPCLQAARIDCCALANNHILDWGRPGLTESLTTLEKYSIKTAGAGLTATQAFAPAILCLDDNRRVLVFSVGAADSGIPPGWAASANSTGVALLPHFSAKTVDSIGRRVQAVKRPGDLAILSIHWGGNWGYAVSAEHRMFAHQLVDRAGIDLIHGHSSHHPKGIEVYRNKLILYGCGDFIDDYEGIAGYEEFRSHLVLTYLAALDAAGGKLVGLRIRPFQINRFQLQAAALDDVEWLRNTLNKACEPFGSAILIREPGVLALGTVGEMTA